MALCAVGRAEQVLPVAQKPASPRQHTPQSQPVATYPHLPSRHAPQAQWASNTHTHSLLLWPGTSTHAIVAGLHGRLPHHLSEQIATMHYEQRPQPARGLTVGYSRLTRADVHLENVPFGERHASATKGTHETARTSAANRPPRTRQTHLSEAKSPSIILDVFAHITLKPQKTSRWKATEVVWNQDSPRRLSETS